MQLISTGQWTGTSIDQLQVEGAPYGAKVSVILEDMPPGSGPRLHWHPYGETWVVVLGLVAFSDGNESREASAGDVIQVAPNEAHKFTVLGEERVKMICIHQGEKFQTNWLE